MNVIFNGKITKSGYGKATESFKRSFELLKDINVEFRLGAGQSKGKYDVEFLIGPPPYGNGKIAKHRVIYFYWETTKLPTQWISSIMNSDEIWAPCDLVADACLDAGYNKKISIVPTPSLSSGSNIKSKFWSKNKNIFLDKSYKFYSIFQWQPRKGYDKLLDSYFDEFRNDDVTMVIKTDMIKTSSENNIISTINYYKDKYKSNAKVFLITSYLSDDEIYSIHNECNCFVLPHSGEGWGMPIHEAATFGNPIVTTKFGGVSDFIDDNCFWIDYNLEPVTGMSWNNVYNSSQYWASCSKESIMKNMRYVFDNKLEKSKKFLDFTPEKVSNIIKGKLNEI